MTDDPQLEESEVTEEEATEEPPRTMLYHLFVPAEVEHKQAIAYATEVCFALQSEFPGEEIRVRFYREAGTSGLQNGEEFTSAERLAIAVAVSAVQVPGVVA